MGERRACTYKSETQATDFEALYSRKSSCIVITHCLSVIRGGPSIKPSAGSEQLPCISDYREQCGIVLDPLQSNVMVTHCSLIDMSMYARKYQTILEHNFD